MWCISTWFYIVGALITIIPVIRQFAYEPKPVKIPEDIDENIHFSDDSKKKIKANYSRISGALGYWKHQAKKNRYMNSYVAWWVIPASILIPTLTQATSELSVSSSKLLITVISTHTAIALVLVQRFKTEINFRAYREGESEFYDTFRKLLDSPNYFGENEEQQLNKYFEIVEDIRKRVREGELSNIANLNN